MNEHKRSREKKLLKPHAIETGEDEDTSSGIDISLLERRLEGLRDTQESVQGLSLWCQTNKRHSTIIIETWLRILRKSPVEKRLTLFYLCNDVIQHAKKKNDPTVVNQWAFAVQKATPHVRTPSSVSAAISRIFKIWEERSIYSKDAIADLLSLLNNVPAKDRVVENNKPETYTAPAEKVSAFQPSSLISKSKLAFRLKSHLGVTFRSKKYVDMDMESFKAMIKDRTQGLEVIHEISQYLEQLKASEAKLATEVEERRKIVETSEIALVFYENVRGEAKIVNAAYKNFTTRVMSTSEKVDEKIRAFDEMEGTISPVPSPPAAAPSPPPDEDDFGVRPANKCGGAYATSTLPAAAACFIEVVHNNTKDISQDIKAGANTATSLPPSVSVANAVYTSLASMMNSQQQNSSASQYDSNQTNQYQSMPSIQQLQQAWSTSGIADTYATMSMSMPNLNFMQQFQQSGMPIMSTGYGTSLQAPYSNVGYETYQPSQSDLQTPPPLPPDISTIPLPPAPTPPQPPPPLPQEAPPEQSNIYSTNPPPPPPINPFEVEFDSMYPPQQHSSFSEPSGYDSSNHTYNSQATSQDVTLQGRYHPYNSQSPRGRRISGPRPPGKLMNSNANLNSSNRYPNNNTSPTGSQIPPLIPDLSPMERFSQSLSKSRISGLNNTPVPESPVSPTGDWPSLQKDDISQSNYVQSQNSYYMTNNYVDFDDSQNRHLPEGLNGSETGSSVDSFTHVNNIFDSGNNIFDTNNIFETSLQQTNNRGNGRGNMHSNQTRGGARGIKHLNNRGMLRGGNRGGIQNSRGFSGFRGSRGMLRGAGPSRGRGPRF